MVNAPTQITNQYPLWDALKQGSPELSLVPSGEAPIGTSYDNYPGFADWLDSEYALGWPTSRIKAHLKEIRDGQIADLVPPWPEFSKRDIDRARTERRFTWVILRDRLSANIENAGVLAKNTRLLSLARTAEELESQMWDERNSRTGELYLLKEYRETLRQIGEEKGELGEQGGSADNTLLQIAETLARIVKVQGTGVQEQIIEGEWNYADDEEATVRSQGRLVETSGVQAEPGANPLPQD